MEAPLTVPYDWIKILPPEIRQLNAIPFMGNPPHFPWESLTQILGKYFECKDLNIASSAPEWRTKEAVREGIGEPTLVMEGVVSPLAGSWFWVMSEKDVGLLMSLLVTQEQKPLEVQDPGFLEGFFHFIGLQTINGFSQLYEDKELAPRLKGIVPLHLEGPGFSRDITITLGGRTLVGRLILTQELYDALTKRFSQRTVNVSLNPELAKKLEVTIHLEIGSTVLSVREFSKISLGDFILLDRCSVDPGGEKARVMLTLNGNPLFRGKLKQGNVKILEIPLYHETEETMANHTPGDEDSEFDTDFEDIEEETEEEEPKEESEVEEEEYAEGMDELPEEEDEPAMVQPAASGAPSQTAVPVQDLPMTVVVEVGRIQMSIQKLMELQPGNVLELDVHSENGVDLVVNNKLVGKGELIRVGEALGVRVLDLP